MPKNTPKPSSPRPTSSPPISSLSPRPEHHHTFGLICTGCYSVRVEPPRLRLGYTTCMTCGEKAARAVRHTIAPLNKSNYIHIGNPETLKQLNPKRTT